MMNHQMHQARLAALSILQAYACAKLLRSHGRVTQATNLESAVGEVTEILAHYLGDRTVFAAIDWAQNELREPAELAAPRWPPSTKLH